MLWRASRDHTPGLSLATGGFLLAVGALRLAGVPHVDIHGPLHRMGIMDPLCGGTRATYLLASGDFSAAAEYNPVVFPLAVVVAALAARLVLGITLGIWLQVRVPRPARRPLLAAFLIAVALLEIRQQVHAELLMQPWSGT